MKSRYMICYVPTFVLHNDINNIVSQLETKNWNNFYPYVALCYGSKANLRIDTYENKLLTELKKRYKDIKVEWREQGQQLTTEYLYQFKILQLNKIYG